MPDATADTPPFIVPPCEEAVEILFRDDSLLIVDKPAGLLSVPGRHPANRDCLIGRLQGDFPEARIVHRLDMATSGLMVVALGEHSHRQLSKQFEQRRVSKAYRARLFGELAVDQGCIDLPLACDWPRRPRQHIHFGHGKTAQTHFRRLGIRHGCSDVLLIPHTGRSHQLRVHTASIGHPILGCEFYAHASARRASDRLLLHSSRLGFAHPLSGETLNFQSPPPFADTPPVGRQR